MKKSANKQFDFGKNNNSLKSKIEEYKKYKVRLKKQRIDFK